jgi:hypothetical protein
MQIGYPLTVVKCKVSAIAEAKQSEDLIVETMDELIGSSIEVASVSFVLVPAQQIVPCPMPPYLLS